MPATLVTRPFRPRDYDAVVRLWRQSDGVEIAEGDDRATVLAYLRRNPGLSRVAFAGTKLVGAVLCGHDGRRGLIYHLAVRRSHHGQGVGTKLLEECMAGLRACGIRRVLLLVAADNARGRRFWADRGFEEIVGARPFGADLL
jgi:ribosomal protein S18 acetylase RimI-like enzyme